MAASILSIPVNENHEKFLDNISKSNFVDWALWIRPDEIFLEEEDIKAIIDSFASKNLVCFLSHISRGGAMSNKIREYKRAFGNYRNLTKKVMIKNSIIEEVTKDKYYCDVTYATGTDCAEVTSFVNKTYLSTAISFLPLDDKKIEVWSTVAIHFLTQILQKRNEEYSSNFLNRGRTLLKYIESTIEIGGIPVIVWEDANVKRGLVFLGNKDCLSNIFNQMSNYFKQVETIELDYWNRYGIGFVGAGY